MTNDVQAALALLRAHVGDLHQVGTVRTEALATRLDDALDVLDDQARKREVEVLLDECIRLRAQLATATTQREQAEARVKELEALPDDPSISIEKMLAKFDDEDRVAFNFCVRWNRIRAEQAEQRLQDAGALHLADESTIYQLERQVQTLTAMWTTLHSALGLPADQGVSADLVVGRLRSLEGAGRKLLAELSRVQLDAVQAGAGVTNRRVLELRRDELAALLTSSAKP